MKIYMRKFIGCVYAVILFSDLKEVLKIPENEQLAKNNRVKPSTIIAKLQSDPRSRDMHSMSLNTTPVKNNKNYMTLGPKKKLQKVIKRINVFSNANTLS